MAKMEVVKGQDPHLLTADEFNSKVTEWGKEVKSEAKVNLESMTDTYSGKLSGVKSVVSKGRDDGVAQWVGFRFQRYGVFVTYGVGRGWRRQGGTVTRYIGDNVKRPVKRAKGRKPKDWLDPAIDSRIEKLADTAGEYYGDESMRHILEEFNRLRIKK